MKRKASHHFFQGAILLTMAGLISKVLAAGYRIPLQNIAGDVGFYIYQQVYPIIGMAWMISIYGLPVAISTLVAEEKGKGHPLSVRFFFIPLLVILLLVGALLFGFLYVGAPYIAEVMGDTGLEMPIRVASIPFLLIPLTSLLRGTFQGMNDMTPTAYSQMVEQVVRVTIIIVATVYFVEQGYSLYHVGAGAAFGSIVGGIMAILLLSIYARKRYPSFTGETMEKLSYKRAIKTIVIVGLFLCVNYMMLLFIQMADAITMVPNLLQHSMDLGRAQQWKGIFDRGYPLIQLGTVIGSSLSLALVPSITKQRLHNKQEEVYKDASSAVKFSFLFSSAAAVGLILVLPGVNRLFFNSNDGTVSLQVLALVIFVGSMALTFSSLLQGLGSMKAPAFMVMFGFVIKLFLNELLIPLYGMLGSAVASVGAITIICIGNGLLLKKALSLSMSVVLPWRSTWIPLLGMTGVVVGVKWVYALLLPLQDRLDYLGYTFVTVGIGVGVYGFLLVRRNAFTNEELLELPLGQKMIQLIKRRP
ncbi:putative polysaccharide biosynthesis protein [Pontibacillus yanchengensis]|uniref:Polysaccharide biosynthesis protein n=1 Tax=Pontibacillus yanchengensis Y32 TaxID=1385514 RepID=A0A0A2TRI4_9BACI|nr:polysaccharide biosynthesis protein [Pontibacillus yanchengensis]KGP71840.1 polysaccharide biosynthesis protein [Pontibacillus yanchengensis Y32]